VFNQWRIQGGSSPLAPPGSYRGGPAPKLKGNYV